MDKVSLHSKSNSSLTYNPSIYPKDLDPFGEEEDEEKGEMSGGGGGSGPSIKVTQSIASSESTSYPGTLDPFADEDGKQDAGPGAKVINNNGRSSKRISNHEMKSNHVNTRNGNCSLETSITSRTDKYDKTLDPFGCDEDDDDEANPSAGRQSSRTPMGKPAIVLASSTSNINENESSFSTNEAIKRGGNERRSYSNQNSPVPVPPRRKHRNLSPSTKSLNRASYSTSSLERGPTNDTTSSPKPDRLSTVETDSYLSHSISNLSTRSNSPINTVRSSPVRSRKKRRAPEPPGFPPTSPRTPNSSLVSEFDTTIDTTTGSITPEPSEESTNTPKTDTRPETPSESTSQSLNEPAGEPIQDVLPDNTFELKNDDRLGYESIHHEPELTTTVHTEIKRAETPEPSELKDETEIETSPLNNNNEPEPKREKRPKSSLSEPEPELESKPEDEDEPELELKSESKLELEDEDAPEREPLDNGKDTTIETNPSAPNKEDIDEDELTVPTNKSTKSTSIAEPDRQEQSTNHTELTHSS